MGRTIKLREAVRGILLTLCDRVYYKQRKGSGTGEYIVFLLTPVYGEVVTSYDLDISVVGFGTNTENVSDLADFVWETISHYYYIDSDIGFAVWPNSRNPVEEEDPNIIHERMLFNLSLVNGGQ